MNILNLSNLLYYNSSFHVDNLQDLIFVIAGTVAGVTPLFYLAERQILIALIRYFTTKRTCKTYLKESSLTQRLFFSKFKTMIPKHIFVINYVSILITLVNFFACIAMIATYSTEGIIVIIIHINFVIICIAAILKSFVLGKGITYSELNFDAIYKRKRGRAKKRNKTRIRNPRKKK